VLIPHIASVNTPTKTTGIGAGKAADLSYWESAARMIARACTGKGFKVIVEKSTVPVKTAQAISKVCLLRSGVLHSLLTPPLGLQVLASNSDGNMVFEILSNPEFLAEGTAMEDLKKPDRVRRPLHPL
jgi:UDPglucose 6-dehydrogenase